MAPFFADSVTGPREYLAEAATELARDGFRAWPRFLTEEGVARLEAEVERLRGLPAVERTHGVVLDEKGTPMVMNRLDRDSDLLFDLHRTPTLVDMASALLGDAVVPLHVEYFAKRAGAEAPTPPHQDAWFYRQHFSELALALWLALDDVGPDSGALEYAMPERLELLPHTTSSAADFDGELRDAEGLRFQPALVPRGGCVAHHSLVVHRAPPNRSGRPRRAVVFNYRSSPFRRAVGDSVDWVES